MPHEFEITEEHVMLSRHMYVDWDDAEFGAPKIDPKRPYGNSNVIGDMAEILGLMDQRDDNGDFDDELVSDLTALHAEMKTALQIWLQTGKIQTGIFILSGYDWMLKPKTNRKSTKGRARDIG